ncbi:MAG: hypothetical protein ABIR15_13580 [Chitinophagaceae bacterium]
MIGKEIFKYAERVAVFDGQTKMFDEQKNKYKIFFLVKFIRSHTCNYGEYAVFITVIPFNGVIYPG